MEKAVNQRILDLIKGLNLNKNSFSVKIGVAATNLTHIENDRSYPSYELLEKILISFPNVNATWLMLGVGQMFIENETNVNRSIEEIERENKRLKGALDLALSKVDEMVNKYGSRK